MATELDAVRKKLNSYDEAIRILITLRMALIPIVTDIKIVNSLPLFQGKREDEIYKKIEIFSENSGIDSNLLKKIYKLIISCALQKEEDIVKDPNLSILSDTNYYINHNNLDKLFNELDTILDETIPNIISKILNSDELSELTLSEKATIYYNEKTNRSKKL